MHPRRSVAARVGKYELVRQIATGGMAEIFLARAVGIADFEKVLVLKRILPTFTGDARLVRMFLDEARVAATLRHSNIVQVFEVGQEGDSFYFTMEFVHGADVRRLVRRVREAGARIPLEHTVAIAIEAAAGLHHAHERRGPDGLPLGLVHRDVSPSNLLVGFDGAVKLADFGIARATLEKQDAERAVMGKAPYMSPEQVLGQPLDRRSDVYSLGVVLHELVTGDRLWQGDNDLDVMRRIADETPAAPSTRAGTPAELDRIVLRALERDRAERYATAEELRADLETFARGYGLFLSRAELARWMEECFHDELEPWLEAQRTGVSLSSFATASIGTPLSPGETATTVGSPADSVATVAIRPARRRGRRWLIAAATATAAAVLAAVLWMWPAGDEEGTTPPSAIEASEALPAPASPTTPSPAAPAVAEPTVVEPPPSPAASAPAPARSRRSRAGRKPRSKTPRPAKRRGIGDDSRLEVFP